MVPSGQWEQRYKGDLRDEFAPGRRAVLAGPKMDFLSSSLRWMYASLPSFTSLKQHHIYLGEKKVGIGVDLYPANQQV